MLYNAHSETVEHVQADVPMRSLQTSEKRSKFNSWYIPNKGNDAARPKVVKRNTNLSAAVEDDEEDVLLQPATGKRKLKFDLKISLFRRLSPKDLDVKTSKIIDACTGNQMIYFIVEHSPRIYQISAVDSKAQIVSHRLLLNDCNAYMVPQHIRVNAQNHWIYATGFIYKNTQDINAADMNFNDGENSIVKFCSKTGQQLSRSKRFEGYEKFGAFDVVLSTTDVEHLWVCSPQPKPVQSTVEFHNSQIVKISADFKQKLNYIDIGKGNAVYKPTGVKVGKEFVFVATERREIIHEEMEHVKTNTAKSTENDTKIKEIIVGHRVITFPVGPPSDHKLSAKEWLTVNSWHFQDLAPGDMVLLQNPSDDSDNAQDCVVLVLDTKKGTINKIEWPAGLLQSSQKQMAEDDQKALYPECENVPYAFTPDLKGKPLPKRFDGMCPLILDTATNKALIYYGTDIYILHLE